VVLNHACASNTWKTSPETRPEPGRGGRKGGAAATPRAAALSPAAPDYSPVAAAAPAPASFAAVAAAPAPALESKSS